MNATNNVNWHRAINKYTDELRKEGPESENTHFMYEAKYMALEIPRMQRLFADERNHKLRTTHKQCSHQEAVPVTDNHLKCCLGKECRKCPHLLALDKMTDSTDEEIDNTKAWTCASHIVWQGGDTMGEGYLLTVCDRMYWDNVYNSLAGGPA